MTILGSNGGFPIYKVCKVYKGLHFCKPSESMQVQTFRLKLQLRYKMNHKYLQFVFLPVSE